MFVYIVEGSPKCLVNIYHYTVRVSFLVSQKSFPSFLLGSSPGRLAKPGPPPGRRHLSVSPRGAWISGPRGQPVGTLLRDIHGASAPISTFKVHSVGIFHIYYTVALIVVITFPGLIYLVTGSLYRLSPSNSSLPSTSRKHKSVLFF